MNDLQVRERTHRAAEGSTNQLLVCFALALVPLVVLAIMGWDRRWMSDDGFIHLRVVDQLLHGHGLVFNAGERVEASTSPLWVLVLAATRAPLFFVPLEWIAVLWGLVGSVAGLAMAERGAWLLGQRSTAVSERSPLFLPLGALVVASLAPFWDFATSGLEGGMVFAWLGASFWALAARLPDELDDTSPRRSRLPLWGTAVIIGLGPIIRPDLALFSAAFLVALLIVDPNRGWKHRGGVVFAALALAGAYEIFRMAYFAALVPNTALAKEPGMAAWGRGVDYLWDFVQPYWLWLPLVILAFVLAARIVGGLRNRHLGPLAVTVAPLAGGLAYGLYVVRIGGDFMHARLLLPALFAILLPVAVVPVRNLRALGPIAVVAVWAVVCTLWLRVGYDFGGPGLLANERNGWVQRSGHRNPVMIDDFASTWAQYGTDAKQRAQRGDHVFQVIPSHAYGTALTLPLARDVEAKGVVAYPAIGEVSFAAGTDVYVVDLLGLGDPIGSRVRVPRFFLPGHNKQSDPSWAIARFVDPQTTINDSSLAARVADARVAIHCGLLADLFRDVTGTPTSSKLADGFVDSWALTRLRYDSNPSVARLQLCR